VETNSEQTVQQRVILEVLLVIILHSVQGYSKFGSYTGNGNADGTFVYTGFKPAFVM
jgi:hypothetical protein